MGTSLRSMVISGVGAEKIDRTKPMIENADGTFSTERTITVEKDGKHYLVPTIVNGKQLEEDEAITLWETGRNKAVGVYNSAKEAEAAAVKRSDDIGKLRGPEHKLYGK